MLKSKFSLIDIIVLFAIASTTLYVIANNLPKGVGSYRFFWAPLCLLSIFFSSASIFLKKPLRLLLIYGVVTLIILQFLLWNYLDEWNVGLLREEFYGLIVASSIWAYYSRKGKFIKLAIISKWALVFIVITILMTHIALFIDPNIIRDSANSYGGDVSRQSLYNRFGIAGYGYAQGLIALLPILIYFVKMKRSLPNKQFFIWSIIFLILLLTIRANVFANILIAIPIMILASVSIKNRGLWLILSLIFVIFFNIIPSLGDLISNLAARFDSGSFLGNRLHDMSNFIENPNAEQGTQIGGRIARYPLLFEAFAANPLLGDASDYSKFDTLPGGHLYFMNKLTLLGLPVFLFFMYVLFSLYTNISKYFDTEFKYYYNLSVLTFILFGLTKNTGSREMWFFLIVIIPGLFFLNKRKYLKKFMDDVGINNSLYDVPRN